MKRQNLISQLTLELYYRGLATYKERRQVEKALKTDGKVQSRYKAIQESDHEVQQILSQELSRLNIQETPHIPILPRKKIVWGIITAAAIMICVSIPAFLYLKHSNSNKGNAIAENPATNSTDDFLIEDNTEVEGLQFTSYDEDKYYADAGIDKPQSKVAEKTIINDNSNLQQGGVSVAVVPQTDTGIRTRGQNSEQQSDIATPPEQESNLNIPPGLSSIFENMFANKLLVGIVIPGRITSIGKNAFAGNPVVSVTIGANVAVDDDAIPGNFAKAYNSYGKAAGTYTRPDSNSEAWEKK